MRYVFFCVVAHAIKQLRDADLQMPNNLCIDFSMIHCTFTWFRKMETPPRAVVLLHCCRSPVYIYDDLMINDLIKLVLDTKKNQELFFLDHERDQQLDALLPQSVKRHVTRLVHYDSKGYSEYTSLFL